jgi:hypothetical protein
LAGQCSKLKCCLNYELDCYIDAQQNFPPTNVQIETEKGNYNYLKADIFKGIFWYVKENYQGGGVIGVSVDKVKEILRLNRAGKKIPDLTGDVMEIPDDATPTYQNSVGQESLDRFDQHGGKSRRKKRHKPVLTRKNPSNTSNDNSQNAPAV